MDGSDIICLSLTRTNTLNRSLSSSLNNSLFHPPSPPRLPSPSSRQRADAGKHFLSPRSYFLSLGIHFLFAANTTALRAFLSSHSITHTRAHTIRVHAFNDVCAQTGLTYSAHCVCVFGVCDLFSFDSGSLESFG